MYNYKVNATGHVDLDSKESLIFLKLFPYVLATFALLGSFTKVMWELYDRNGYISLHQTTSQRFLFISFRLETTRSLVRRYTTAKNTVILENVKLRGLTSFVLHKN